MLNNPPLSRLLTTSLIVVLVGVAVMFAFMDAEGVTIAIDGQVSPSSISLFFACAGVFAIVLGFVAICMSATYRSLGIAWDGSEHSRMENH